MFLRRAFPSGVHLNLLATPSTAESTIYPEQNGETDSEPRTEDVSDVAVDKEESMVDQTEDGTHTERIVPRSLSVKSQPQDSMGWFPNVDSPLSYDLDSASNPWNPVSAEDSSPEGEQATTTTQADQRKLLLSPILKRKLTYSPNPTTDEEMDATNERKLLLDPLLTRISTQPSVVDNNPQIVDEPEVRVRTRRSTSSFPTFLQKIAESSKQAGSSDSSTSSNLPTSKPLAISPTPLEDDDDMSKRRRSKRANNSFPIMRPIVEHNPMDMDDTLTSSPSSGPSFNLITSSAFAKKMEEAGRLRRLQSQSRVATDPPGTSTLPPPPPPPPPPLPPKLTNGHVEKPKASSTAEKKPDPPPKTYEKTASTHDSPDVLEVSKSELERQKAKDAELDDLHDALQRALTELDEAREENSRLLSQYNEEKRRLTQQLNSSNEEAATLRRENQSMKQKVATLQSQLNKSEAELKALKKDQQGWQGQIDAMRERVTLADKQIRCLDGATRSKLEARMEGAFGATRRSQKAVNKDPSAEVVNAVVGLNEEIMQAASLLVENLERAKTYVPTTALSRAKTIFGKKMVGLLQAQATNNSFGFRILLTQASLEAFMVHWSMNIIEAWYPVRQTFADLLIDLASQATSSRSSVALNAKVECGKVKIVDTTPSATVQFPEWVRDILTDLTLILSLSGLQMKPNRKGIFTSKFLIVVKMAYNVRTALAEKDICGELEACAVSGDMPFQPKWMDEAYVSNRLKSLSSSSMEAELIASTSAIGLQRLITDGQNKTVTTMVLKPKVVLVRVLEESP